MVKVLYNDQLVYKVVIWIFLGISLWKEKELKWMIWLQYVSHSQIIDTTNIPWYESETPQDDKICQMFVTNVY